MTYSVLKVPLNPNQPTNKAINGTTVGHDFVVFVLLKSRKICFCHWNANPVLWSDVQSKY